MKKKLKRFLTVLLATCMLLSTVSISSAEETNQPDTSGNKYAQSKTATDWVDDVYTDVTLKVGGEQSDLGVDIIYIVGSYATNSDGSPNVKGDVLISSLVETIDEIVKMGTVVNFGMVPFSSDNVVAMPLTAITNENIEELSSMIASALATCEAVYDGVNMENALVKSKKMFSESSLVSHPERQHLVMITSGLTYFFNSGENNEYAATVPVNYSGVNRLFYWNKAWQRARTNQTNTYPIPKGIVEAYNAKTDKAENETLWDFYWSYIDQWTKADIAAGDKVVYEACTIESGNFLKWYNSGELVSGYSQTGYGKAVPNTTEEDIANAVTLVAGANPLEKDANGEYTPKAIAAAHAIGYERAMWEAYEYAKANITGAGINFYPIYNALTYQYNNGVWSDGRVNENGVAYGYNISYTNQYIGHSFVNMLAGGEAVMYDKKGDKAFFDTIKRSILYSLSAGTSVIDYIGYNADPEKGDIYDFDFVEVDKDNNPVLPILTVGNKTYITEKLATANNGATYSYVFKAPGTEASTFTLDYYRGNGKEEEHFIWNFGENVSKFAPVSLTYRLKLMNKTEMPGSYTVYTNQSAILKPIDSDGNPGQEEEFERPYLTYKAYGVNIDVTKSWDDDRNRDNIRPDKINVRLYIKSIGGREELVDGETIDNINGEDIAEVAILESGNNWKYSWPGLRKFLNGQEIVYAVEEVEVPENYEATVTAPEEAKKTDATGKTVYNYIITNKHKPEETTVSVVKVWDDANNQDGLQPESIQVELLANGQVLADQTVVLSVENEWKHTWNICKNEAGEPITYTVQEVTLSGDLQQKYTVAVTGGKNDDGETFSYTITNTHVPEVRSIFVNKVWEDDGNRDGIRPESVTVNLLADGEVLADKTVVLNEENEWGHIWENLPVNKTPGIPIVYTVEEVLDNEVLQNEYTTMITESQETPGVFVITNTHEPYRTSVTVNKKWVDQDNYYEFRTQKVFVQLLADGEPYGEVVELNSENGWTHTWGRDELYLNKENEIGKEIVYTVEEVIDPEIPESLQLEKYYDIAITDPTEAKKTDDEGNVWYDYTITNSLKKTSIVITKYIDKMDQENATAIFRYLITGGPNNDYRANVTINFENGTVKVKGEVQGEADTDLSDNIGFDKAGLSVTIDGLDSGVYQIMEYSARGYELVKMTTSEGEFNCEERVLEVTAITNDPGEAYFWNRYNVPEDYTAVNRFSVNELGKLDISIKRK